MKITDYCNMATEIFNRVEMKDVRRELRRNQTPAERLLWEELRGRKLAGRKFRRQHSVGNYVVDFYCAEAQLIIELDGAVHNDPDVQRNDREREAVLCELGLTVMRFKNEDVECDMARVLYKIEENII